MTLGVGGNYDLRMKIGDIDVNLTPSSILEFRIESDLDSMLPVLYMELNDATGFLTHIISHDNRFNRISVTFTNRRDISKQKSMKFKIFRRKPESSVGLQGTIKIIGLLDIPKMFGPQVERGWYDKTLFLILTELGNEMGIRSFNVDAGLNDVFPLVQPNWVNGKFLKWLANGVQGSSGDVGYFVFVDNPVEYGDDDATTVGADGYDSNVGYDEFRNRLNFVSLTHFLRQKAKFTLVNSYSPSGDEIPIHTFDIYDNFDLMSFMGISRQSYGYFDFDNGDYVESEIAIEDVDFQSLTEYIAYDETDAVDGLSQSYLGRSNDFIKNYDVVAKSFYYKKINSLVKVRVSIDGLPDINLGDIVKVIFAQDTANSSIFEFQYSGFWMVEKISHSFGGTFITSLMLTRPGYDTNRETKFMKATNFKRV